MMDCVFLRPMSFLKKSGTEQAGEMSFLDHLDQLRKHILRSLVAVGVVAVVVFLSKEFVFQTVIFGPKKPDFITYRVLCALADALCLRPPEFDIITRELGEQFIVHIKTSFWLGLVVAFPYVFYEFWKFVRPALYPEEQKAARGLVLLCSFLFSMGVAFGYFILSPFAITFLAGYDVGAISAPTLMSYVDYMTMFTIPVGLIFELPVVIWFLSRIGLVTPSLLRTYRRQAIIVVFLLSAIITPPDVTSQIIIALPVLLLYEVSIYISGRVEKNRLQEEGI
jgi:sec-independent protein translocase protein TatC